MTHFTHSVETNFSIMIFFSGGGSLQNTLATHPTAIEATYMRVGIDRELIVFM